LKGLAERPYVLPMHATETDDFVNVVMPRADQRRRLDVVIVSSVALSFISFWRAAAIVLNDMASTVYYIGGISEQAIGRAAPWFVFGVMLFAYAVRAVYVESCTMFTRGGVYRVVKQAEVALFGNRLGGMTAKLSVSALMFDYILTGPISAVSAGQYLVGMIGNLVALPPLRWQLNADVHPDLVRVCSMVIAIAITAYFWRINIIGIHESSQKAMRIMQLTTIMGVTVIGWALLTIYLRPATQHLPPIHPVLTAESEGWLTSFPRLVGAIGIVIAFGHTLLAMSGEESLAQVYREIEAPKVKNLLRAGFVIVLYSLLLTGLVSFFAVMIIPDNERIKTTILENGQVLRESAKYTDNLISGLVMHMVGPLPIRLAMQAFVVFVGFLILSGAVNTSIVGSNGVLNRLAEDGILTPGSLHPHPRFGTTHRLINIVCGLQVLTIVASMGNVYTLGEAYAFGVIWSFVFKSMAMIVLRFVQRSPREYEVPLNIRVRSQRSADSHAQDHIDLPIGIAVIFVILLGTAVVNLFTKKVATIWGIGFTLGFLTIFLICEQLTHRLRRGEAHAHLEQFNQRATDAATADALALAHPHPVIVAIRNPRSMPVLDRVLHETDTTQMDIVAITCKVLPPMTPGISPEDLKLDDNDREVLTRVVNLAEEAGKRVHPVVLPTNNPLFAIATTAVQLGASEIVMGASGKTSTDVQLEQFAIAWGMATADANVPREIAVRIIGPETDVRQTVM
jgi:nucleotide-binding universal stress UspA family protein